MEKAIMITMDTITMMSMADLLKDITTITPTIMLIPTIRSTITLISMEMRRVMFTKNTSITIIMIMKMRLAIKTP